MPDIVSRIKIEAQGIDQAAREIRKLKQAYDEVGEAAKGLSPTSVASADPFAQATARGGAGQAERNAATEKHNREIRERESANRAMGQMARGGAQSLMSVAESIGAGRPASALGGIAQSLGGMLGGAGGLITGGLLAAGGAAMMTQRFADTAYGRMSEIYGAGISQRLNRGYQEIQNVQAGYGRMGIPLGMVRSFFSGASRSGFNMEDAGALDATSVAMEAMAELGVDPGVFSSLFGQMSRNQLDLGRFAGGRGYNLIKQGAQAFGEENVGMYLQQMSQGIQQMASRGIDISEDALTRQSEFLSGLATFGGMSPEGAAAMAARSLERGRQAAQLQRPEDIMAFQAMRRMSPNASTTEIMLQMERNPDQVNQAVYQYLQTMSGDNEDLLRLRMQRYLGGTMSETVDFIATQRGILSGEEPTDTRSDGKWRRTDAQGNIIPRDFQARRAHALQQSHNFQGIEEASLRLVNNLQELFNSVFIGDTSMDAIGTGMTWQGYKLSKREATPGGSGGWGAGSSDVEMISEYARTFNLPELNQHQKQMLSIGSGDTGTTTFIGENIFEPIVESVFAQVRASGLTQDQEGKLRRAELAYLTDDSTGMVTRMTPDQFENKVAEVLEFLEKTFNFVPTDALPEEH